MTEPGRARARRALLRAALALLVVAVAAMLFTSTKRRVHRPCRLAFGHTLDEALRRAHAPSPEIPWARMTVVIDLDGRGTPAFRCGDAHWGLAGWEHQRIGDVGFHNGAALRAWAEHAVVGARVDVTGVEGDGVHDGVAMPVIYEGARDAWGRPVRLEGGRIVREGP